MFFDHLEFLYDPLNEWVFLANCVGPMEEAWPQGGSGYLLSRAAAAMLEPLRGLFLSNLRLPEDMSFHRFFQLIGRNITSVASPNFCGHKLPLEDLEIVKRKAWGELKECPRIETLLPNICAPLLTPIRDIVFYHEWDGEMNWTIRNIEIVAEAEPFVMWHMDGLWPNICIDAHYTKRFPPTLNHR
jgi:hypothetical protein